MIRHYGVEYSRAIFFAVAVVLGLMGAAVLPYFSDAQIGGSGGGPHPLCISKENACRAQYKQQADSVCPGILKAVVCPELKCQGFCVYGTMMCEGVGCSGNKKGDGDKASGMPKIPEMPKPPEKPPEQPKNDPNNLDTCIADPASTSSPPKRINKYTGQPCEDASKSALSNFLDDTFKDGSGSDSGGGKLKDIASDILSSLGFGSKKETSPVKAKDDATKDKIDKTESTSPKDSTDIEFKEEVFEGPDGVTLRGSGFDAKTNTGIAGFFGRLFSQRPLSRHDTFLGRLCTARPWQASFITRLFSPAFFDSLCARRGYAVGGGSSRRGGDEKSGSLTARATLSCPANAPVGGEVKVKWDCFKTRSAGIGFDTKGAFSGSVVLKGQTTTTYALQCANGRRASCTTIVATPRAQIVAHPPRVRLNSRSTIYWTSEFVSECTVTGPGMKERGLRGAATTIPILDRVVFSIVCKVDGGADLKESVTVDVGP